MARHQGLPQLALRRTTNRHGDSHQGSRTRNGRQLRRLGWDVQHVRLRGQGRAEEGGSVQLDHRGFPNGWVFGDKRGLEGVEKRCDHVWDLFGGD